ncbi:hypothetical protein B0O99DRAFT_44587 [Bisporella sp. PMI_857]|nr:hypothetical protein B0O99DRAFT_44587 [Bisporella sp. PMI_857]
MHPPEYYINQDNKFDEGEFDTKDYRPNTLVLFDVIKDRFYRCCKYVQKTANVRFKTYPFAFLTAFSTGY